MVKPVGARRSSITATHSPIARVSEFVLGIVIAAAVLAVSVLLSWGLYRLYEYPIEKRLRALLRREPRATAPAPGAEASM